MVILSAPAELWFHNKKLRNCNKHVQNPPKDLMTNPIKPTMMKYT